MKPKTKKQKGSGFEREVASSLRESGLDKTATRMVLSGAAFGLEGDIRTTLPIHIEAKRQEVTKFMEWYRQSEGSAAQTKIPVVVWRENNGQPFVFFKWNDLLELMTYAVKGGWTERLPFHK